jgi:hypothetical protein
MLELKEIKKFRTTLYSNLYFGIIDKGYFEISIFFGDSDWSVFNNLEFTIGLEKRIGLYLII